jgi:DNA-binding FrmR family transcriptional regulator
LHDDQFFVKTPVNTTVDKRAFFVYTYLYYTPVGYINRKKEQKMINESVKKDALTRLKKIEGQVRGIMKMVQEEKYCIDTINQITAAEKALDGVAKIVMKRHVESCVSNAIVRGEGQDKIDELIQTVFKYSTRGKR